jgi:hypothetical protein
MTCFGHCNFELGICLIFGACDFEFCLVNYKISFKDSTL